METVEERLGCAESGRQASRDSRGGRGGGHLLLDARGEVSESFGVLGGTAAHLPERGLGTLEVLLEATDAVERHGRLEGGRGRELHGLPHAVGDPAMHPSSRLLARGRIQGNDGRSRAWARLRDQ